MARRNKAQATDLPESPWRYFTRPRGTVLVPIRDLCSTRAVPKGIADAKTHMRAAYRGDGAKRVPITIAPGGTILDGNSTYAVAKKAGWVTIPATVVYRWSNPLDSLSRKSYPSIFGDSDKDSIPDVDDPRPFVPGDTQSIEEVRLSDEIGELLDVRESFATATQEVMDRLEGIGIAQSEVQGRVKTPFSLINKLRRKRLGTLTDVGATRIVVPDKAGVKVATAAIEGAFEILEKEDFYKTPQAGYRAIHYIVRAHGVPIEVQVKTRRMSAVAQAGHTPYKRGTLDPAAMDRLTKLADSADRGDAKAIREIDALLRDPAAIRRALTKASNPRTQRLARRVANGH